MNVAGTGADSSIVMNSAAFTVAFAAFFKAGSPLRSQAKPAGLRHCERRRIVRIVLMTLAAAVIAVGLGVGSALLYLRPRHERFDGVVNGGARFGTSGDSRIGSIGTCDSDPTGAVARSPRPTDGAHSAAPLPSSMKDTRSQKRPS